MVASYTNGKIYQLTNTVNDESYIGSTCSSLNQRLIGHKSAATHPKARDMYARLNKTGWENISINLLELCPCDAKIDLHKRERYWIETLKPVLNSSIPTRTLKEYYEANKEEIQLKARTWRQNNREESRMKIREHTKRWKAKHPDYYREYRAIKNAVKVQCPCGSIHVNSCAKTHLNTKKHLAYVAGLDQLEKKMETLIIL
jgi:group I intron endonuclease